MRLTGDSIRKIVLDISHNAGVGHIGSALSIADIVAALYSEEVTGLKRVLDPDRFVLSKGHAAAALYAALFESGYISEDCLNSYAMEGGLEVHPINTTPGVDFTTGSLGMGLSYGIGAALAAKQDNSTRVVYVLMSDAELNEGSTWEAVMLAGHHRLNNLIVVLDYNKRQALGDTSTILDMNRLTGKLIPFGWNAFTCDGHDQVGLVANLTDVQSSPSDKPTIIIANTILGKGVSFMEGNLKWHYWTMSDEEYEQARKEL